MNQTDETEIFRTLLCSVFSSNLLLLLCDYKSCKRNSHHLEHGCRMVPMRIYIKLIILAAIQRNSVHEKCARTSAVDNDSEHFFFHSLTIYYTITLLYYILCKCKRIELPWIGNELVWTCTLLLAIIAFRTNFMSHFDFSVSSRFNRL